MVVEGGGGQIAATSLTRSVKLYYSSWYCVEKKYEYENIEYN